MKRQKTNDSDGACHSWHEYAPWRSDKSTQKQRYVNPSRRGDGWYDYGPTTVNLVPNPQVAKAEKVEKASYSVRALGDLHF